MRILSIAGILCLLICHGCVEQEDDHQAPNQPPECQLAADDYSTFMLHSLDVAFDFQGKKGPIPEFDAVLVETPLTGESGCFVLRVKEGKEYRLEPDYDMDWEKQLDGLQLGETYHFVFALESSEQSETILGIKVLKEESLMYLALSRRALMQTLVYGCDYGDKRCIFKGTELEGLTFEQLRESKCQPNRRVEKNERGHKLISLVTSLPMVFQYGGRM